MIQFREGLTTGVDVDWRHLWQMEIKSVKIRLGNNIQLNDYVHISAIHSVEIGDGVLMASHVYVSDNSHGCHYDSKYASNPDIPPIKRPYLVESVKIRNRVWLVEGVIVMPGVNIGDGSIIGAHSIVNKDIPENCVAAGAPAKVVKRWDPTDHIWIKI